MTESIQKLKQLIAESDNIVFFGGAGVSTESGIPDFRSVDGLFHQKYAYPPQEIVSRTFFEQNPEEFYRFYRDKLMIGDVKPNRAHLRLAELEREGKLKAVITQNVDGLHQAAGSREVLELHGSTHRYYCTRCKRIVPESVIADGEEIPYCTCGGLIRPDVVLYEEQLDAFILQKAVNVIRDADVLIVGGTSLAVYPAAGLLDYYQGDKLVLINKSPTPMDRFANLLIPEKIGAVFAQV